MFLNKACSLYQQVLISSLLISHNVTVKVLLESAPLREITIMQVCFFNYRMWLWDQSFLNDFRDDLASSSQRFTTPSYVSVNKHINIPRYMLRDLPYIAQKQGKKTLCASSIPEELSFKQDTATARLKAKLWTLKMMAKQLCHREAPRIR